MEQGIPPNLCLSAHITCSSAMPSMALRHSVVSILLACFFFSFCSAHQADMALHPSLFNLSNAVCDLVKCIKGSCVASSVFPYYACQCNSGWKSLFGMSSFPCVLPNCTVSMGCSNTTTSPAPAAPPVASPTGLVNVCSFPVCGNGRCIQNSTGNSSSDSYECQCDAGYTNLLNKADGFCLRQCSIGADCSNLNIGGSLVPPPPPPPPQSSSQNSNQGPKQSNLQSILIMMATLALVALCG